MSALIRCRHVVHVRGALIRAGQVAKTSPFLSGCDRDSKQIPTLINLLTATDGHMTCTISGRSRQQLNFISTWASVTSSKLTSSSLANGAAFKSIRRPRMVIGMRILDTDRIQQVSVVSFHRVPVVVLRRVRASTCGCSSDSNQQQCVVQLLAALMPPSVCGYRAIEMPTR